MCISVPVSRQTSVQPTWLQQALFDKPRRLFAVGGVILLLVFLLNPISPFTSLVVIVGLILMAGLATMTEDGKGKVGYEPMSGLRVRISFWFVLLAGISTLFGGMALYVGIVFAAFGSNLIISDWRRRRFWLTGKPLASAQ